MGLFKKYPHIELLHRVPEIMAEPRVVVQEKPDGTNFRYGWVDGRFRIGGHNEEFDFLTSNPNACFGALGWARATNLDKRVEELARSLGVEIIFHDEWFGPGVQKRIVYSNEKQQRTFDVRIDGELVDWERVVELTERLGHRTVPLLYEGKPDMDVFNQLRVAPSKIAYENDLGSEENIAEGIVIKPTRMHKKNNDQWIIAKHKAPKFSERKSLVEGKAPLVVPACATTFLDEFITLERLEHVLSSLRSAGVDVMDPKQTGTIIQGMYADVIKESGPEFEQLDEESQKAINKRHGGRTKILLDIWKTNSGYVI